METVTRSLPKRDRAFIETVWSYYRTNGRHDLPWRRTTHPYHIIVSEMMLQQTQVARVVSKYRKFLSRFPTTKQLATAPLREVLRHWQGLGYNRRAKYLHDAAKMVFKKHNGSWPHTYEELVTLPGIGTYTASAVLCFAYNIPTPLIETNVRTVYLDHFFKHRTKVSDKELLPHVTRTLDRKHPREWNWALMDYGAYRKATSGNSSIKSTTYIKQAPFKHSTRYVRGAIIRILTTGPRSHRDLKALLPHTDSFLLKAQLQALSKEGLVVKVGREYRLP
jgi:A/G-specific adenine glycosylase